MDNLAKKVVDNLYSTMFTTVKANLSLGWLRKKFSLNNASIVFSNCPKAYNAYYFRLLSCNVPIMGSPSKKFYMVIWGFIYGSGDILLSIVNTCKLFK